MCVCVHDFMAHFVHPYHLLTISSLLVVVAPLWWPSSET